MPEKIRCPWAKDAWERAYHDTEWCVPEHEDGKLFELLILEGMQAGLSWRLILHKREHMRRVFDGFNPTIIAGYGDEKKAQLLQDPGIIRNKAKINALVTNADAFLTVQKQFGSFDAYLWGFVNGTPVRNSWREAEEVPASTPLSDRLSQDLKKRGFKFVGSTICYSYLQAAGLVNDHLVGCDFYGG